MVDVDREAVVHSPHPRRSRARPISPTVDLRMQHLESRIEDVDKKVDGVDRKLEGVIGNQDLNALTLQRVEAKMDTILLLVGSEQEDGQGGYTGVGLLGRMRRAEEGQRSLMAKYRTWIAWGAGFTSAMTIMVAVIWWLIADKVEFVLKGTTAT